jgi:hypothetical protein
MQLVALIGAFRYVCCVTHGTVSKPSCTIGEADLFLIIAVRPRGFG